MNKKGILIIFVVAFVLLLGGAGLLYNNLKDDVDTDNLVVENQNDTNENSDEEQDGTNDGTGIEDNRESEAGTEDGGKEENSSQENQDNANRVASIDFTVYDKDGNEVHLTDFLGKPVVLNFWASWCGPCQAEMPDFEEKYKELGEEVQFMMINMTSGRETKESADVFLAEQGYTFPVFYDTDSDAASTYGAYSLPTSYFIDAEGYVVARATGMIDGETLAEAIGMIYNQE